jgi:serine phosphatase RsbU (regulator of sigma subunit)
MLSYNLFTLRRYSFQGVFAKSAQILFVLLFLLNAGQANAQSKQPEEIKLYDQAIKRKDYKKAAQYAYSLSKIYNESKDQKKASDYLNLALSNAKKSDDNAILYASSHQLGVNYLDTKKYSKALENYLDALTAARQLNDNILIKEELMNVSVAYNFTEKYKKAIEYADEALAMSITQNDVLVQQKCYQLLSDYYAKQGNKNKSVEYLAQYNLLIKTKQNEELKKREVKELKRYIAKVGSEKRATETQLTEQTKKLKLSTDSLRLVETSLRATSDSLKVVEELNRNRALQINLLQKDKELTDIKIKEQETRIKNEELIRNFIIVGSGLSVALIIVLIISYRKKTKANIKIDHQNKNIKSSINYAKRIQEAMLPRIEQHPEVFRNSFILFRPRDTVSGDFYWLSEIKNGVEGNGDIAFAAVDCTGHGVPGAFMSMIGINALNGLINRGISETNLILDSLDNEIRTALRQDSSGNNDGMDIALCIYRQGKKCIEYSGAKNPLVYIQNNELFQVKGDIHSIGGSKKHKQAFFFKKHEIQIDKPTTLYLFSDGYKDQFGGKDNAKFMSKQLNELLLKIHRMPMEDQIVVLQKTIDEWKGTRDQTDDILVMGLKIEP